MDIAESLLPEILGIVAEYIPGSIKRLAYGEKLSEPDLEDLVKEGFYQEVKYYLEYGECDDWYNLTKYAAMNGDLYELDYLLLSDSDCFNYTVDPFAFAAWIGNLEVLDWLLDKKIEYDYTAFALAAHNEDHSIAMNTIKWMIDHKFPYDTTLVAYSTVNLETLKWLYERGYPYDEYAFEMAAWNTNPAKAIEIMEWLLQHKFPYVKDTMLTVSGIEEINKWIAKNL